MPMHALRLTGTHAEPRWLHGERTRTQAEARASGMPDDPVVLRAMDASLHLHTALPGISDAAAAEHAHAAIVALDDMIKALRKRNLPRDD